ncbi:MAG: DUF58 domain-containing protein [Gammaproteobacteria bacterium]
MRDGISISFNELVKLRFAANRIRLHSQHALAHQLAGQQRALVRGRGVDFEEVRIYQAGDEIRNMDWRVTARTGKPHTKIFREERERPVLALVDYRTNMLFGTRVVFKSVLAAQTASMLSWAAYQQGYPVGGTILTSDEIIYLPPLGRQRGILTLLKSLAEYSEHVHQHTSQQADDSLLTASLQRLHQTAPTGSLVFLISDFNHWTEQAEVYLSQLAKRHDVRCYFIYDQLEATPPPPNRYALSNGLHTLLLDTRIKKVADSYAQQFQRRFAKIKQLMTKYGIRFTPLATHQTILDK